MSKAYVQGYFERDLETEFKLYREMYDLPAHDCVVEDAPGPYFNLVMKRRFFIIVFIYTSDYKMYAIPEVHPKIVFTPKPGTEPNSDSTGSAFQTILGRIKSASVNKDLS